MQESEANWELPDLHGNSLCVGGAEGSLGSLTDLREKNPKEPSDIHWKVQWTNRRAAKTKCKATAVSPEEPSSLGPTNSQS